MNTIQKLLSIIPVSLIAVSVINMQSARADNVCKQIKLAEHQLQNNQSNINCKKLSNKAVEKPSSYLKKEKISNRNREDTLFKERFSEIANQPDKDSVAQQLEVESSDKDPNLINSTKVVPNKKINPFVTTIPLNGNSINHLTKWKFHSGYNFANDVKNNYEFKGIIRLDSQVKYSVTKDNIFISEQTGNYSQLQTVRKNREITTTQTFPQTLQGFQLQFTFTGNCLFPGTNSNDQCSYLPSLNTKDNINSDTFIPNQINLNNNVGEVLSPESVTAIKQPGFQKGANGQDVAFDLYIPRTGVLARNSQSDKGKVDREDKTDNTLVFGVSRVRQIVKSNNKKAVIGRTIRSTNLIVDDDNFLLNSAVQLGSELIPDIEPELKGSGNKVKPVFNKNLFLSANNTRLPANSLTIYQGGIGEADNPKPSEKPSQSPAAKFNSFWLGLSPVTKYSYSTSSRYEATASERIRTSTGFEGGSDYGNNNVSFLTSINGEDFSTLGLTDFYVQMYQSFLQRDVNLVNTSIWKEETEYYPHLSITGNITDYDEVFKYYGGMILSEDPNAYLGLDYTKVNPDGWLYQIGGIAYTNPDRDYYSNLQGSIIKNVKLNKTSNLLFSTGFNWALDRRKDVSDIILNSRASSVTLGAKANFKPISIGVVGVLGDILPESRQNSLLLNLGFRLNKRFHISGYWTPISESSSYSQFGTKASLKLGDKSNSPRLNLNWLSNKYNFGKDQTGRDLETDENVFQIKFSMGATNRN